MKPEIAVLSEDGERIGATYERRARQLVEKERAVWAGESRTAIRLLGGTVRIETEIQQEEPTMEAYDAAGNNGRSPAGAAGYVPAAEPVRSAMIDEDLYLMAKKRAEDRFHLIMHWGAFVVCQLIFLILAQVIWRIDHLIAIADVSWLVGILMHTLYFFAKITPGKIQREYERLSRRRF